MKCETYPNKIPCEDSLGFNGSLMVRFYKNGDFYVFNGSWEGSFDGTHILVNETGKLFITEPFLRVVEITDEERQQWYFSGDINKVPQQWDLDDEIPY